jgi:hypothetical protein
MDNHRRSGIFTKAALLAVLLLFCVSLFSHLGRPLLWNDEGMTVMHTRRVLEFGYPKAWDGKNMVYDLMHPNKELGLEPRTGAFIGGSGWGHYYFLAPFMPLAEMSEDLNTRTGLLRLVFALTGLLGLLLMARMLWRTMADLPEARSALLIFGSLVLLSVPLVLHLREVRYYSLLVLLSSALTALVVRHRMMRPMRRWVYTISVWLLLAALLITFSPAFFVFVFAMGSWEGLMVLRKSIEAKEGKVNLNGRSIFPALWEATRNNLAIPLALVYLLPFFSFFHTFEINRQLLAFNVQVQPYAHFLQNLKTAFGYVLTFEPGWLWLGLKGLLILRWRALSSDTRHKKVLAVSGFLALLSIGYLLLCSRVPNFPFTRYFLPVIPLMAAGIALDASLLWRTFDAAKWQRRALVGSAAALMALPVVHNLPLLKGHVQEIANPPQGHLDLMIPWIQEHFPASEKLVIAANYEETSFMYYLDAKVIVGYVLNNLPREVGIQPDIIYFNSLWNSPFNLRQLEDYKKSAEYEEVHFPIRLYRVNNVPEVNYQEEITHQFSTLEPRWEGDDAVLLVRKDLLH